MCAVPINFSKNKTSLSAFQYSFNACSEALSMLVLVCLATSAYLNGMVTVSFYLRQFSSLYFGSRYSSFEVGSKRDQRSVGWNTKLFPVCWCAIGHFVVRVLRGAITFQRTVTPILLTIALAVPSLTRRTTPSAIPSISER